ncbi:MAG TPA: SH3 domain-containing protein, partial [Chloroflexi bacterium]|nr:SH3 domain-containing protein [Chloroflexota bacterium]
MLLHGKGLWAYREAELTQALQMAPQMHITHILYKVGQGPCAGNPGFYLTPDTKAAQIAQTIRQAGMIPLAWSFTTLGDPTFEADMVVRAFNDGYDGFIFNMEDDCSGRFVAATQLTQRLQNLGVDSSKLYLCSYPTPLTHHPDLPYNQMGPLCQGGLMPMAYGTYLLPPDVVIDEWTYQQQRLWMQKQGLALPIYPVLGFYKGDPPSAPEDWFTKAEVQLWLNQLAPHQPTFFSVFTAAVIKSDYYAPIRAFSLGDPSGLTGRLWVPGLSGLPIHTTAGVNGSQTRARSYRDQLMGNGVATTAPDGTRWVSISDSDGSGWVPENAVAPHDPGPWPALDAPPTPPPGHLLTVWSTTELNVRSAPAVRPDTLVGRIPDQTRLTILQDTQQAQSWIGQLGKWLRVRIDPNGPEVWVAAWYVTDRDPQAPSVPSLQVKVISPTVGYLNIRKGPATTHPVAGRAQDGEILDALEPAADVERKVGQTGKWLEVRTAGGVTGYAAAWYLQLHTGAAPEIPGPTELHYVQVNSPGIGLNIRSGPGVEHTQTWWVPHTTILRSLEAPVTTAAKVGQQGQWLRIRTPGRKEGYVAAWYLEAPPAPDNRQPVSDSTLPYGSSAWIFGIHAVTVGDDAHTRDEIRALYQGKAVKGWIFFTEAVGATPQAIQPNEAIR